MNTKKIPFLKSHLLISQNPMIGAVIDRSKPSEVTEILTEAVIRLVRSGGDEDEVEYLDLLWTQLLISKYERRLLYIPDSTKNIYNIDTEKPEFEDALKDYLGILYRLLGFIGINEKGISVHKHILKNVLTVGHLSSVPETTKEAFKTFVVQLTDVQPTAQHMAALFTESTKDIHPIALKNSFQKTSWYIQGVKDRQLRLNPEMQTSYTKAVVDGLTNLVRAIVQAYAYNADLEDVIKLFTPKVEVVRPTS